MGKSIETFQMEKICGPHCVGVEEGDAFFKQLYPLLKDGKEVCLDFSNILTITSSFLNAAIGKLFGQFEDDSFESLISYNNLDESDTQLLKLVISNAKEHFKKNQSEKEIENKIVERSIEEQKNE